MAQQFNHQIAVNKKRDSLIEFIDLIYTKNEQTGQFNYKVLMNLQESKNGNTERVSFYWDLDEIKQLAYEIRNGLMKDLKYPTSQKSEETGQLYLVRGGNYGRVMKVGANKNYVVFEGSIYSVQKDKSKNGEVVLGEKKNEIKYILTDYEARIMFGKLFDYIQLQELRGIFGPGQPNTVQHDILEAIETQQEEKEEAKQEEVTPDTPATPPVVPGKGKMAGKTADQIPSGQHEWFIKTFQDKPEWKAVTDYLKGLNN